MIAGVYVGRHILPLVSRELFVKLVLSVLFIFGIAWSGVLIEGGVAAPSATVLLIAALSSTILLPRALAAAMVLACAASLLAMAWAESAGWLPGAAPISVHTSVPSSA